MATVAKDKTRIYEALFSSPGMGDKCKVSFKLSRQNVVLLCRLIEAGLKEDDGTADELILSLNSESRQELQTLVPELLQKSNLSEFYEKLRTL